MKDKCVMCDKITLYDVTEHIDSRYGYVEGAGQLCIDCYEKATKSVQVPVSQIVNTPNDMELGSKVRKLYNNL
jgi:hypothetical protein